MEIAKLRVGAQAPDFTLMDERGEPWSLSQRRGRVVALLFYPADETLVCTRQLCSVRDNWAAYLATGADVVGISPGTSGAHFDFKGHHRLPLPLLADPDAGITRQYTSHSWLPKWATRALVVVDAEGIIRCRKVIARIFRPTDAAVILAIRHAQTDLMAATWLDRV